MFRFVKREACMLIGTAPEYALRTPQRKTNRQGLQAHQ